MKGSDDYASRRPRPRPSAPPPGTSNNLSRGSSRDFSKYSDSKRKLVSPDQDDQDQDLDDEDDIEPRSGYPSTTRRPMPSASSKSSSKSGGTPSKTKGKSRSEREAEKKERSKRLRTLLSNQAICLTILFALVAGYNWMAADYSGEYISQDGALGLVKLSLVREATYVDGELSYKGTSNLEMQQGEQPKEHQVDLTFIAAKPANTNFGRRWLITRARFLGTIDGSTANGAIVDAKGSHDVKLTKNIVASLFKQLQHHTPSVNLPRPPKLFQVPVEAPRAPLPNETDSTKPFTYGGTSKPSSSK
ncbi:hypothetical protein KA344_15475 [bacterium]|nr:hypothetical protein [bacterium]